VMKKKVEENRIGLALHHIRDGPDLSTGLAQ